MRKLAAVAGALLGLLFIFAGVSYFFMTPPADKMPPPDSPMGKYFAVMASSHYFAFIKVMETVGGLLVAIPLTRRLGLLVLGPIIVNILAALVCLAGVAAIVDPMVIIAIVLALFLVFAERRAFIAYIRGG
jgi:putative oxidoreductase